MLNLAALLIAVLHSLAPDHYLPYVAIGKARGWAMKNVLLFSFVAGLIHVSSSVGVGYALILGINLLGFAKALEEISAPLLIFVGFAYAAVSVVRPHRHVHSSSVAILLAVSLSPCLPLIPLMLASNNPIMTAVIFSSATMATIVFMTYVTSKTLKPPKFLHGREDFLAGLIIAGSGIFSMIVGVRHEGNEG